jgi:ABC-2 type transport system permease protein
MLRKITNIEAIKTLYSPSFKAIIILHSSLFLLVTMVAGNMQINIQGINIDKLFQFPHVWNTLAWIASWFNLLLGILAIMLITNEFQFRTFRKQLIDGLSRNELILGKLIAFFSIAIYTMLLVFITGLLMGLFKSSGFSLADFYKGLSYLPVLFLQSFGYMILAMLFAFIFRNSALSIVSFILYFFPVEPIMRAFIPDIAVKFMPVKVIANLTPMPDFVGITLGDLVNVYSSTGAENHSLGIMGTSMPLLYTSMVTMVYLLFFVALSNLIVKRKNF